MNAWLLAACVLLGGGFAPCVALACRGEPQQRLAAASLAAMLATVIFLLLAQGFGRSSYVDLALVLGVLAPAGTLVFTRLLRRDAVSGKGE